MAEDLMDRITSLAKRRGFIFQSSDIYGGIASVYDYGPLGVLLKNNVKAAWWKEMVQLRPDVFGLDSAILMSPRIWEASGHVENFTDPLVECKKCKNRFRADQLEDPSICPECNGDLSEPRDFNGMFKTSMGSVEDEGKTIYLRPETAQGIYVNFPNVVSSMNAKLPFGIAQIGKSFRNEITSGPFTFRTMEFEQMELQYFIKPRTNKKQFETWKEQRLAWYENLGLDMKKTRLFEVPKAEMAHYAKRVEDFEYKFPFGWKEIEGLHDRGDWDLKNHMEHSGKDLRYFDQANDEKFIPNIIETSAGADRNTLAFLVDAYTEEEAPSAKGGTETRTVLKLHKDLAPIKVAVLPLSKKTQLTKVAKKVYEDLAPDRMVWYDETQSIGKRYRRQDEIGTPFCVTVDFDSLEDKAVTVRDRDTMKQERVPMDELSNYLKEKLS